MNNNQCTRPLRYVLHLAAFHWSPGESLQPGQMHDSHDTLGHKAASMTKLLSLEASLLDSLRPSQWFQTSPVKSCNKLSSSQDIHHAIWIFLSISDNVQNAFFSSCPSYATLQLAKCSRWTGTLHAIWNQLKINSQLLQLSVSLCFIHFSETSVASGIFFGMRNTCTERLAWAWGGLKRKHFS